MQRTRSLVAPATLLVLPALAVANAEDAAPSPEWPWEWVSEPGSLVRSFAQDSPPVAGVLDQNLQGEITIVIATPPVDTPIKPLYRPVAFDRDGNRHVLTPTFGAGNPLVNLGQFVLANLQQSDVARLGVERLSVEARAELAAAMQEKYRAQGIRTLPHPELGERFEFELETTEATVTHEALRGKVVIVDCWATWCGPCLRKMPNLQALQDSVGRDRLAVIGVNFDSERDKARQTLDEMGVDWPQVWVGADPESRRAWHDIATVSALPRIFVMDGEGKLRGDFTSNAYEEFTRELLESATR